MSVILFEETKFLRICETLKYSARAWDISTYWVFKYKVNTDRQIEKFCQKLANLNVLAFNNRYDDGAEKQYKLDFINNVEPYNNIYELLKSLRSVRYNTIEAEKKYSAFDRMLEAVTTAIIDKLPEYEKAKSWV